MNAPTAAVARLPSGVLIAVATAGGYWLAHTFEAAYLEYFHLPPSLAHTSTNTIIIACGAVLSVMWVAFTVAAFASALLSNWDVGTNTIVTVAATLFRGVAGLVISPKHWQSWVWQLGVAITLIATFYALRTWERRRLKGQGVGGAKTSQPKSPSEPELPIEIAHPHVARILLPWIGKEGLVLMFVLFLASGVAHDAGRAAAESAQEFYTVAAPPELPFGIVIRIYDDVLIASEPLREDGRLPNRFVVIPVATESGRHMSKVRLGPLTTAEVAPPEPAPLGQARPPAAVAPFACLNCHPG